MEWHLIIDFLLFSYDQEKMKANQREYISENTENNVSKISNLFLKCTFVNFDNDFFFLSSYIFSDFPHLCLHFLSVSSCMCNMQQFSDRILLESVWFNISHFGLFRKKKIFTG